MATTDDTISSARVRREEMRQAMIDLESVISSPSRAPTWMASMTAGTQRLRAALARHIEAVEAPDGILAEVIETAPHLVSHADQLRQEHGKLATAMNDLLEQLEDASPPDAERVDALRVAALDLLGRLSRHRQKGVDLVYDAFDMDIGGTG